MAGSLNKNRISRVKLAPVFGFYSNYFGGFSKLEGGEERNEWSEFSSPPK